MRLTYIHVFFFFSSRRRHTRLQGDWSSDVCSSDLPAPSGKPMAVPDLESFARRGKELMGQAVRAVVVNHPGDASARIGVYGWNSDDRAHQRLSPNSGMAMFSAATGEVLQVRLPGGADGGTPSLAQAVMGGLHMVKFGGLAMKWLYFLCGLAGAAMMATGAILFMVKRRSRHQGEFGSAPARVYRLGRGLDVGGHARPGLGCLRSEGHTAETPAPLKLVCRLL